MVRLTPMNTRMLSLTVLLPAMLVVLTACGDDDDGGAKGVDQPAVAGPAFELTEDLGCGFGFARADAAGETLLTLFHQSDASPIPRSVDLPAAGWEAQLTVGTNLTANWCNDVIEEPQAEVEETWEVVEGTLTFADEVPPADWDEAQTTEQPVEAELRGVVVESPDGERVELGDIPLSNSSWGFLAG
ncbi:hypothetical protein [Nocardioides stalactiti]|uniref:hypothetical protein n=1 Tax=Nocardioides stalactiti TaxID=2755356 RepID=UPI00160036C0|nr:hypothetical protein [Nocardioides stalactiti]